MQITGNVGAHMRPLSEYPHIDADATLGDLFALLKQRYDAALQFRSVLVFDKQKQLVGKISLHDLLEIVLPDYLTHRPKNVECTNNDLEALAHLWQDDSAEDLQKITHQRVGDHVRPAAPPLEPDAPMTLALYRFANSNFNTIPIAENGKIVGVLRIVDVLAAVAAAIHPH